MNISARAFALLTALPWISAVHAETFQGQARVIDGDTLRIGKRPFRLIGIDAPESRQTCRHGKHEWACGHVATSHMKRMVRRQRVTCQAESTDRYGRWLAVCWVEETDLGQEMVLTGLALAYRRFSTRYVDVEDRARTARHGIWGGEFEPPEQWRRRKIDGASTK